MAVAQDESLVIPAEALRRSYYLRLCTLATVGGGAALIGMKGCRSGMSVSIVTGGSLIAAISAFGLIRVRGVFAEFVEGGFAWRGIWRTRRVPWAEIEYLGWFIIPQLVVYGRYMRFPLVKARGSLPIVLLVSDDALARRAGLGCDEVCTKLARLSAREHVEYRERVPDLPLYLQGLIWVAAVMAIAVVLDGIASILC